MKILIDGRNLLNRTYFSCLNNKDSNKYEAFLIASNYYASNICTGEIIYCWDTKAKTGEKNFRQTLLEGEYKAGRPNEHREALKEFEDSMIDVIDTLGITQMFPYMMEADDIIAYLCLEQFSNEKKMIISTDQDFVQLVDEDVSIFSPTKKVFITPSNIVEYTEGISAKDFLLYKCVMGDKSDNVSGFPKHGHVKAKKVVETFDTLVLTEEQKEILERNRKIMDLRVGYKEYPNEIKFYERQLEKYRNENPRNMEEFKKHVNRFVMGNIASNISVWEQNYFGKFVAKQIEDDIFTKLGLV